MKNCLISDQTVALIGFALKSRQVVKGYEAVRRALQRNKLALVLVSSKISKNGLEKIENLLKEEKISLYQTSSDTDWEKLWGVYDYKIMGFLKGKLGSKISENLKSGV